MIRVFLADDHPIVRMGLRALLSATSDIEVVGEACDGWATLTAIEDLSHEIDVLVLDIGLPRLNGIEVLRRLKSSRPQLPVLMLSMHSEEQYARRLIAMGAAGYVSKDRSEKDLITAVQTVSDGRVYVRRLNTHITEAGHADGARGAHERLSARQLQIFLLIGSGRTVSEIAAELNLTVSTVSTHLGHVKDKLGVRTTGEVIGHAHQLGLVQGRSAPQT